MKTKIRSSTSKDDKTRIYKQVERAGECNVKRVKIVNVLFSLGFNGCSGWLYRLSGCPLQTLYKWAVYISIILY